MSALLSLLIAAAPPQAGIEPVVAAGSSESRVRLLARAERPVTAKDRRVHDWQRWRVPELDPAEESALVIVPAGYAAGRPHGLLVFVSPGPQGMVGSRHHTTEQYRAFLERHRLIHVGCNASGNDRPPADRLELAMTAVTNLTAAYAIDDGRVYVAGFSGGAKMACIAGRFAPEVFDGVVAVGGAGFHRNTPAVGVRGLYRADMALGRAAERDSRRVPYVFVTGPGDGNHGPVLAFDAQYRRAGYRTLLIDVPGLGHEMPGIDAWDRAVAFVEQDAD